MSRVYYDSVENKCLMENIFYFRVISAIGGTEQFLYEIAKKYHDIDITVFYDQADPYQLARLSRYVRCLKRVPKQIIKCRKAFFNFNIDMIDDVEAERYYFISHANYEEIGYKPPINHPKLTDYIGVSKFSRDKLDEMGEIIGKPIHTKLCYNPLTLEEPKKVVRLISATRLDDKVKGGQRTLNLIHALDNYCALYGRQYIWLIFTNQTNLRINSPNVCLMPRRIDIRPYIADSDYLVQLSNDMETYCYSINEALGYGVPVVTTPLSIMKELPVTDTMHIECDWDMSNADQVAAEIFERKVEKFKYVPPEDDWSNLLSMKKSTYKKRGGKMKIKALMNYYDTFEKKDVNIGDIYETTDERACLIISHRYAEEVIEEEKSGKRKAKSKKAKDRTDQGSGLQSEEEAES